MSRETLYTTQLFLSWLNQRYGKAYALGEEVESHFEAAEAGSKPMVIDVEPLFEADDAWQQRREALARRLDDARPGSYVLWLPPGAELPAGEPEESEWVRRVVLAASRLASGRTGEVRIPVKMALGKVRDEGGYASVVGGLGRHWTHISERLSGSFYLDSRGLNRFTRDEEERSRLYDEIALLSQGLATGDLAEFEHEDAWSVQRLPRGEGMTDGWLITGCPPGFVPEDGGQVRRLLRRRLADAAKSIGSERESIRALVLIGGYDYIENENAGPALRGFDPGLTAPFDIIVLISDADVKPILLSRGLPFQVVGTAG